MILGDIGVWAKPEKVSGSERKAEEWDLGGGKGGFQLDPLYFFKNNVIKYGKYILRGGGGIGAPQMYRGGFIMELLIVLCQLEEFG